LTLSVFNDVKSPGQSFHYRHFLDQLAPPPDNPSRGYLPPHAQYMLLSRLLPSFSNRWVRLDTVSRQIFGNIQETQFSDSKMEVHVHLKNAVPGGSGNRWITFGYNLWFASHPSVHPTFHQVATIIIHMSNMFPSKWSFLKKVLRIHAKSLSDVLERGDGHKPKCSTNSIEFVYL